MQPALKLRAAAGLAAALFFAVSLEGAEKKKRPGRHKVGPLYVTPAVQITTGVDTNVFQTFTQPTKDAVTILSPRLDGVLPVGRRLNLTGFGAMDVNYYRRQNDERSIDFQGAGRAELLLGPFTLFGGGGGGQFTQRFSIDVDDRIKHQEKRGYAGAVWRLSRRFSATGQVMGEVYTFEPGQFRLGGDIKQALDRNTLTGTVQLRFALTRRTTLVAAADALEDRFFSQPPTFPRVRQSHRYVGGFEFSERALLQGQLLLGIHEFPGTLAQGTPPYRGPVVSAALALPLGRIARLQFTGDRDVVYASSIVEVEVLRYRNAFIYDHYLGELSVDMPLGLIAIGRAAFEQSRYLLPIPYPDANTLVPRADHRYTAGLALLRRFGDSVRVGGQVLWSRRVSNIYVFDYEDTRYGLTAEIRP
jgi:hypothetical protein